MPPRLGGIETGRIGKQTVRCRPEVLVGGAEVQLREMIKSADLLCAKPAFAVPFPGLHRWPRHQIAHQAVTIMATVRREETRTGDDVFVEQMMCVCPSPN